MAACTFSIPFSGNASEVLNKARRAVEGQRGTFAGDDTAGNFHVSFLGNTISGSYTVSGQTLHIVINTKPFLIPCSVIESFLKAQMGSA